MGVGAGWYYDSEDDDVVHQNLAESLANVGFTYFHGPYKTEAEAVAHTGISGPAGSPNESLTQQVGNVTTGQFLGVLTSHSLWTRVVEGVAGAMLLGVGLLSITGIGSKAAKVGKTAGKAGMFL